MSRELLCICCKGLPQWPKGEGGSIVKLTFLIYILLFLFKSLGWLIIWRLYCMYTCVGFLVWHLVMDMHTALECVSPDSCIIYSFVTNTFLKDCKAIIYCFCPLFSLIFGHCVCVVIVCETLLLVMSIFMSVTWQQDTNMKQQFWFAFYLKVGPSLTPSPFLFHFSSNFISYFHHSSIYFLCYGAYLGSECNFLHEQNIIGGYCSFKNSPMSLHDC